MNSILLFGPLKEIIGKSRLEWANISDTDSLQRKLIQEFPQLETMQFVMAVDRKIIAENISLNPQSEIALLPPYSGG
jgi:molybdopterin synthase sulfur carrier subunit